MGIPEWIEGMLKDGRYRSIYDMSLQIGVPAPTVYRWLKGQTRPSIPHCVLLAKVTDTSVEEVVLMAMLPAEEETPGAAGEEAATKA